MKNFETSKAAVFNELSEWIFEDKAEVLAKPISEICNLLIHQEIFPKCLQSCETKIDSEKPKTETDLSNSKEISLLQIIYKIIEKLVQDQANSQANLLLDTIYWFTYLLFDAQLVI